MITKVVKVSWTQDNGTYGFQYRVYYKRKEAWRKDRRVDYGHNKNLPLTVLNFVLNANNCKTEYPEAISPSILSLKRETYTM